MANSNNNSCRLAERDENRANTSFHLKQESYLNNYITFLLEIFNSEKDILLLSGNFIVVLPVGCAAFYIFGISWLGGINVFIIFYIYSNNY